MVYKHPRATLNDVVQHILDRAPRPQQILWNNPFGGRQFPYALVIEAVDIARGLGIPDLQPYDIPNTHGLWTAEKSNNYVFARQLTKKVLLIKKAKLRQPWKKVLPHIQDDDFTKIPVNRFGTKARGMFSCVYRSSPYAAIKDLIDNDEELSPYKNLSPYDMNPVPRQLWNQDGSESIARNAIKKLVHRIMIRENVGFERIPGIISKEECYTQPINKYGTTLGRILKMKYRNSSYDALRDLVENEKEFKQYDDLDQYDVPGTNHIWKTPNGDGHVTHYDTARRVTLLVAAAKRQSGQSLQCAIESLTATDFQKVPFNRYGTTARGMLSEVYKDRPSDAKLDLLEHGRHLVDKFLEKEKGKITGQLPAS